MFAKTQLAPAVLWISQPYGLGRIYPLAVLAGVLGISDGLATGAYAEF
jgi:hypothetical protein